MRASSSDIGELAVAIPDMGDDRRFILGPLPSIRAVRVKPELARNASHVAPALSAAMTACRKGESAWPLFVHGGVGTGKSRFALLVSDWYGGAFFDFSDLLAEYVSLRRGELLTTTSKLVITANERAVSETEWVGNLKKPRIVIVDDIGLKTDTERATSRELLARLFDARECMPLLVVSNLGPAEIARVYDDRVASRFCSGTVVKVTGEDRRLAK